MKQVMRGSSETESLNPYASPPAHYRPLSADDLILPTGDQRLFTVVAIKKLPLLDLHSMTRNPVEFVLGCVMFKLLRISNKCVLASALFDPRPIEEAQVPPRFVDEFATERKAAESLGFVDPIYITVPVVGPMTTLEMYMVTPEGRIGFCFSRTVSLVNNTEMNQTIRSFNSRLVGDRILATATRSPMSRPAPWVSLQKLRTKNPEKLLQRHRKRLADEAWEPIPLNDRFTHVQKQERRLVEDLIRRRILREATAEEIYAIETGT